MSDERSANAVDKKIGERVRVRRLEISMSQEKLADLLGVTFQQVQKYEKGVNRIAASRLLDISVALEIPVAHFFEGMKGQQTERRPGDLNGALALPGAHELLRSFAALKTPKLRRRLLELVQALDEEAD